MAKITAGPPDQETLLSDLQKVRSEIQTVSDPDRYYELLAKDSEIRLLLRLVYGCE